MDFLWIGDIHPNGSDPLSHAACPISVISWLMRLEVITYLLKHLTTIHFECHIVIPAKSLSISQGITGIKAKRNEFLRHQRNTFKEINIYDSLRILCQTLVRIRCSGTEQTEGTIQ